MGSGGSKQKSPTKTGTSKSEQVSRSDKVQKPVKHDPRQIVEPNNKDYKREEGNKRPLENKSNFQNNNTKVNDTKYNNKNVSKTTKSNRKDLGNFESDSDSEAEDISAVLAATKKQVQEQNYLNANKQAEEYPETYAQRLQREQYKQQPTGIMRQKTIYRNPDEWDIDDEEKKNEMDASFDVGKFKQANVMKPSHQNQLDRDIFSPNTTDDNNTTTTTTNDRMPGHDDHMFYTKPQKTHESFPRYDTSEEALLAEIEQEF